MLEAWRMNRREFVRRLGGGIVVFVTLGRQALLDPILAQEERRRGPTYPDDVNAYLRIAEDGTVTFFSGKIEMGQGVMTSLSQMLAEELGVDLDVVRIVMGDTASCPWDMGTFGSMSTRFFGPAVRTAGAKARLMLTEMAAEKLGAPAETLTVESGKVFVGSDRTRGISYGELARGQQLSGTVDREAVLRSISEFRVIGQSPVRLDGPDKVTGAAQFAGDVRLPGMLYARILRPPSHDARRTRVDTSRAESIPGVIVVHQNDLVAVLHTDPEIADEALGRVVADYDVPPATVDTESIFEHLLGADASESVEDRRGDLATGRSLAKRTFDATYYNAYVAHAPMEPHTATADVRDGKATVWSSTQAPFRQQTAIAEYIGFPPENVRVITPFVGGGFGGKTRGIQANEAALLARITGKPVQVRWSRAEEFFFDTFRPAAVVRVRSGLDGSGSICFWDYAVRFAGGRGSDLLYDVPHAEVRAFDEPRGGASVHPFSVGPWRAPGANTNRFAAEQQIDIMAAAAGVDPLEFRRKHASDKRLLSVLDAAAKLYGWTPRPSPSPAAGGRGRGLACGVDVGTYVATIADVTVDRATGDVHVDRVVAAQDMGLVINPEGATMQMEGCITMGLGYALREEVRFEGGKILDTNFDTYEIPRFSWLPRIETVLVKNDGLSPQGGGEPAIINMGAVVANAVFDATGVRLYHLPMTRARVAEALRTRTHS